MLVGVFGVVVGSGFVLLVGVLGAVVGSGFVLLVGVLGAVVGSGPVLLVGIFGVVTGSGSVLLVGLDGPGTAGGSGPDSVGVAGSCVVTSGGIVPLATRVATLPESSRHVSVALTATMPPSGIPYDISTTNDLAGSALSGGSCMGIAIPSGGPPGG